MRKLELASICLLAGFALLGVPRYALAIAMRDDVPEQSYLDLANQPAFNAIGLVNLNGGTCSGTLVAPNLVVTAAHCWDSNADNVADSIAGTQFLIGPDSNNPLETVDIVDVQVNQWNGESQFDFAVITLASDVTSVTPLTLSAADPLGQTATVVGYGLAGTGDVDVGQYDFDGLRRAAQNTIDDTSTGYLRTDFDMPNSTAQANTNSLTSGDFNPLPLEGTGAPGDSGGPILVDFGNGPQIVGVLNGTDPQFFPNPFGVTNGYGEVCAWAAVSDPTNLAFLQNNGVQVDMGSSNSAPVAMDDTFSVAPGQTHNEAAPGVLSNDSDPDVDPITAVVVSPPADDPNFVLNADGSFVYTPGAGTTSSSFTYMASDGNLSSGVAMVTLNVTTVGNTPPVAVDDAYTTPQDQPLTVNAPGVLMNDSDADGDTISAVAASTATLTLNADGSFTYTPVAGFTGVDTLTYSVTDGTDMDSGTITITVTPVNNPLACLDEVTALVDAYQIFADATVTQANSEILALEQAGDISGAINRASTARTDLTQEAGVVSQDIMNLCATCVADLQAQGMDSLIPQVQTECMNQSDRVGTIQATAISQLRSVSTTPTGRPSRALLATRSRHLRTINQNVAAALTSLDRYSDRYASIVGRHASQGDAAGAADAQAMGQAVVQKTTSARIARIQQLSDAFAARFAGDPNAQGLIAEIAVAAADAIARIQAAEAQTLAEIQSAA